MKNNLVNSSRLFKKIYSESPGGVLAIRRPYNFVQNRYPIFFEEAKGSKVTDIDKNTYLDMMCGYGPIVIGHRNNFVDNRVIKHIKNKGNCLTLTQPTQYKLIKKLNQLYGTDKAIILKTGSDATSLAIRLARSFTGKKIILRCGYHGWHDWCTNDENGVLKSVKKNTIEFKFNDLTHVEDLIKKYKNKIAGLIIWPIHTPLGQRVTFPTAKYLSSLKTLCKNNNIVYIFDEIRSCFRVSMNGTQSIYKVKPDLNIIGKAMGNGYPISAVLGNKSIMDQAISKVYVSSTFFANSLDQIAALSTIKYLESNNVIKKNNIKGKYIKKKIEKIVKNQKFKCSYSGDIWFPFISFHEKNENVNKNLRNKFYEYLIEKKIFLAPYHHAYIMNDHSKNDIKKYIYEVEQSFKNLNKL